MASYIAPYLEAFLSEYFSNFKAENLTIGYSGNATLTGLNLRSDVLDQFNLPFRVIGGRVENLYISLGGLFGVAKLLSSTPEIEVTLNDVYLLLVPPTALPYEAEREEKKVLNRKRKDLSALQDKKKAAVENVNKPKEEAAGEPGFVGQIIVGLINNIKLKIENIHIRFEDNQLKPDAPFSMGVVLKSLTAETADKDWNPCPTEKSAKTFWKLAELQGFGVYWNSNETKIISENKDTSDESLLEIVAEMKDFISNENDRLTYILGPLSTTVKAMVTMKPEKLEQPFSLPLADIDIAMPKLEIILSNKQFGDATQVAGALVLMRESMRYRKYRPHGIPYTGHFKDWWNFANNCLLVDVRRRKQNWSWEHIKAHRALSKKYTEFYTKVVLGDSPTDEDKEEAAKLEDQLDNINIVLIRNPIDLAAIRKKKLIEEKTKALWYGTATLTKEELDEILSGKLPPDEISNIYDLIDYEPIAPDQAPAELPKDSDYAKIKAGFNLPIIQFTAINQVDFIVEKIVDFQIRDINARFIQYPGPDGLKAEVSIEDIGITGVANNGVEPVLLRAVKRDGITHFLSTCFEKNPLDSDVGIRFKFNSEQLEVTYHAKTVQKLVDCFTPPVKVESSKAKSKLSVLEKPAARNIKDFFSKYVDMDIDIHLTAPFIIIPQNGEFSKASSALIFDLGNLFFRSIPREKADIASIEGKIAQLADDFIGPDVLNLAYAKYQLTLNNFRFMMVLAGEHKSYSENRGVRTPATFLNTGEVVVDICQCIIIEDPRLPKLKIDANLPLLEITITDARLLSLVKLGLTFPIPEIPPTTSIARLPENPILNFESELELLDYKTTEVITTISETMADGSILTKEISTFEVEVEKVITSTCVEVVEVFNPELSVQCTNLTAGLRIIELTLQLFQEENENNQIITKPILDFNLNEFNAAVKARIYGTSITASIGGITARYLESGYGDLLDPINLLKTPVSHEGKWEPLIVIHLFMISPNCPKQDYGITRQRVEAEITSLDIVLHQECLGTLVRILDKVTYEMEHLKKPKSVAQQLISQDGNQNVEISKPKNIKMDQFNTNDVLMKVTAVLNSFSLSLISKARPIMKFKVDQILVNFEDTLIKSVAIVNLDSIGLTNLDTPTLYPEILTGLKIGEKLISAQVTIYKTQNRGDTEPDLDVQLLLGSHRITILGSFLGNILGFINHFGRAKKAVTKVSKAAAKKAVEAVKSRYNKNESKIQLTIYINSPQFVLPKGSLSREAIILNLGVFQIGNKISTVSTDSARNAVVDDLAISLRGLKLSRAFLNPKDQEVQAEVALLVPLSIDLNLTRNLSASWYHALPMVKVSAHLEPIVLEISAGDITLIACSILEIVNDMQAPGPPAEPEEQIKKVSGSTSVAAVPVKSGLPEPVNWTASVDIKIQKVGITMYTETPSLEEQSGIVSRNDSLTLADLYIENISFAADIWTNSSMTVYLAVQNMIMRDIRKNTGDVKDFLQRRASHGSIDQDLMFNVKFEVQSSTENSKSYRLDIATTSLQLVLNMTFVKVLLQHAQTIVENLPEPQERLSVDFTKANEEVKEEETVDESNSLQKLISVTGATPTISTITLSDYSSSKQSMVPSVDAKINFREFVIVLLQDASSSETNSILLSLDSKFDMKSDNGASHGAGEFNVRCNTAKYGVNGQTTALTEIISPTSLAVEVNLSPEEGTHIGVKLSDVSLRLSAGTILLASKIASSLSKSLSALKPKEPEILYHHRAWQGKNIKTSDFWFLDSEKLDEAVSANTQSLQSQNTTETAPAEAEQEIRERLTLSSGYIAISLEIGCGVAATPVLTLDVRVSVDVTNWSKNLAANGTLKASAAYNNTEFGTWEYIVEPVESAQPSGDISAVQWEIEFSASKPKPDESFKLELNSKDVLEITVGKTALGIVKKILESFKAAAIDEVSEGDVRTAPYVVKNSIGSDVILNIDNTPFVNIQNENIVRNIVLKNGDTIDLGLKPDIGTFGKGGAQAERNLRVSIPGFKFNTTISVSQGKSRYFTLPNKKSRSGEVFGVLFDIVTNASSAKCITVRSIVQVENTLSYPVDIFNSVGTGKTLLSTVQPYGTWALPLDMVYEKSDGLKFKVEGFETTIVPFSWVNLKRNPTAQYSISALPEGGLGDNANIKVLGEARDAVRENTDELMPVGSNYSIRLQGHILINNLLPLTITFESEAKTRLDILEGHSKSIFCVKPKGDNEYEFTLKLPNFRGTSWSSKIHLLDGDDLLLPAIFTSDDGTQSVCFGYEKSQENNLLTLNVYCPYWMVNYTGQNLSYKGAKGSSMAKQAAGEEGPLLFAFEKNLGGEKGLVQCENSEWSAEINFDAPGVPGGIICETADRKFELTVSIELSSCQLTKVITFTARHTIVNACPYPIIVNETDQPEDYVKIPVNKSIPFYPKGNEKKLTVRADDAEAEDLSPQIYFDRINDSMLRLDNKYGGLRALVKVSETSITIAVSEFMPGEVPFIIVNDTSNLKIRFGQKGGEERLANPQESCLYAWDDLTIKTKVFEWSPMGENETTNNLNLDKDESGKFTFANTQTYKWISFSNGVQRILLITSDEDTHNKLNQLQVSSNVESTSTTGGDAPECKMSTLKASLSLKLELKGIGISIVNNVAGKDVLYLRLNSTEPVWEASAMGEEHFQLVDHHQNVILEHGYQNYISGVITENPASLEDGIQIDFSNFHMTKPYDQQLRRHPYRAGLMVKFDKYAASTEVDLRISELQIDNQIYSATFPRVFSVVPISTSISTTTEVGPPLIIVKVKKSSAPESSVQLISATVILQEFNLGVDMGLIENVLEVLSNEKEGQTQKLLALYQTDYDLAKEIEEDYFSKQVEEAKAQKTITIFDDVQVYKLKFNLSFSMAGATSGYNPLKVLVCGLGATLVNITDKPFDINGMHIMHMRASSRELVDQIVSHYKQAVIKNMLTVVLELDVLGNPYKLLTGLGVGVSALLTEPFEGALQGHLLEGISSGVGTVLDKTVGNLLGSVSLITGSLAKGTEALGLGFLGLGYLSSGVSGLRNVGKKKTLEPIRLARFMKPNSILEPYSPHNAIGASIFNQVQGGEYEYLSHTFVEGPNLILITKSKVHYVTMDEKLKQVSATNWSHKWEEFAEIIGTPNSIDFNQKYAGGYFMRRDTHLKVNIPDPNVCKMLLAKVNAAFASAPK